MIQGDGWTLYKADVLGWCKEYTGPKFHAMLTDPPYHLSSVRTYANFRGGTKDAPLTEEMKAQRRQAGGFMGKRWDGGSTAHDPETWAALAAHLLPGAFIFAFASSRGWHRQAVAMEDAGLVMHPSIFGWGFGSGFPKASRIDTKIDEAAGAEREVIGGQSSTLCPDFPNPCRGHPSANGSLGGGVMRHALPTQPATPLAAAWQGHRYGLQALKPACEPCLTFTKPLTVNPFYVTIAEATFLVEAITCLLYSAPDAESLINRTHQAFRQAVGNFAHGNAGVWESLGSVRIAGGNSGSNLANLTLQDFAVGDALTKDVTRQWVRIITYGGVEHLSAWAIATCESMASMLQSIALLWSRYLVDLCSLGSKFTTEMVTSLTIDQKTLRSLLSQITSASITPQSDPSGLLSLVRVAESFLISLIVKLPSLIGTIAPESVTETLAQRVSAQVGNQKDGESLEPILVFQKPYAGRPLDSITQTGAGSLNIDAARIETDWNNESSVRLGHSEKPTASNGATGWGANRMHAEPHAAGRWPANLLLSEAAAERIDEMSGECGSTGSFTRGKDAPTTLYQGHIGRSENGETSNGYDDRGGASRFFYTVSSAIDAADPLYYCAKASRRERDGGLDGMPLRETWATDHKFSSDPRMDHEQNRTQSRNPHPTVKPLDLCRYLATLLLPPAEYAPRRILVPFCGVASEMIGARLAGWDEVTGIERDDEDQYLEIAAARLRYWTGKRLPLTGRVEDYSESPLFAGVT